MKYLGKKYSRLTVVEEPKDHNFLKVKCICGVVSVKRFFNVMYGTTKSCGCIKFTAGKESKTNPLYSVYKGIINRCRYVNCKDYHRYGGRGIKMKWNTFLEFKNDMERSYLEHIKVHGKKNTLIERINPNGNYCKENCKWATTREQSLNKRDSKFLTVNGVRKNYSEWAKEIGCSRQALRYRVTQGMKPEDIVTVPFLHSNKYAKIT